MACTPIYRPLRFLHIVHMTPADHCWGKYVSRTHEPPYVARKTSQNNTRTHGHPQPFFKQHTSVGVRRQLDVLLTTPFAKALLMVIWATGKMMMHSSIHPKLKPYPGISQPQPLTSKGVRLVADLLWATRVQNPFTSGILGCVPGYILQHIPYYTHSSLP